LSLDWPILKPSTPNNDSRTPDEFDTRRTTGENFDCREYFPALNTF